MSRTLNHYLRNCSIIVYAGIAGTMAWATETKSLTTNIDAAEIYHEYCSVCHGDHGDARSHAQSSLIPPPRDFTSPDAKTLDRKRMIFSVTYGRPNTAMPGWGTRLSSQEIDAVVDYVRSEFMNIDKPQTKQTKDTATVDMKAPMPHGLVGDAVWGQSFFMKNCATCHGVLGDGKGPRAYFILPKPRDFNHPASRAKYNRPALYHAIAKGTRGSEMPAWEKVLTPQEIANVSEFIFQTFIKKDTPDDAQ